MNVHPDAVFHTILHDTREAIPYITAFVSIDLETVHLQMKEIRKEIQDATSYYLINSPTHNTNLLDTSDETINYIEEFLNTRHPYPVPPTTPNSHLSSPYALEHLIPVIIA